MRPWSIVPAVLMLIAAAGSQAAQWPGLLPSSAPSTDPRGVRRGRSHRAGPQRQLRPPLPQPRDQPAPVVAVLDVYPDRIAERARVTGHFPYDLFTTEFDRILAMARAKQK